uniref:AlNc14C12G1434 protein n=1 Tax=Albugo laibachii Nc14 TaxID=890382 RepID=F0W356_9STRA|nr:AlNc14C12G1434 [Albugo laibachii Nc14]|eukprot:CCA15496.1 AlNc14C12G1434 [Albugo laibachii Nc14]
MALWNVEDVRSETEYASFQKAHKGEVVLLLSLVMFLMVLYLFCRFCVSSRISIKKQWRCYPGKILDCKKPAFNIDKFGQENEMKEPFIKSAMFGKQITKSVNFESRAPSAPPLTYLHS